MAGIDYLAVQIRCGEALKEILIAELSLLDYDSMMETEEGLEAYIDKSLYSEDTLTDVIKKYSDEDISFEVQAVVSRNWNEEWEKNYDPIQVGSQIYVRATFHEPEPDVPFEIDINPRMSFGTGHHATTYLMLKNQLEINHQNKRILDAGTGTGILAIMAEKLGAKEVIAYDNNSWSIENAPENLELNNCTNVHIKEGTIDSLSLQGQFDVILANINKNVLMEEMNRYAAYLVNDGALILSGFYHQDEADIVERAMAYGLTKSLSTIRNDWCSVVFIKE